MLKNMWLVAAFLVPMLGVCGTGVAPKDQVFPKVPFKVVGLSNPLRTTFQPAIATQVLVYGVVSAKYAGGQKLEDEVHGDIKINGKECSSINRSAISGIVARPSCAFIASAGTSYNIDFSFWPVMNADIVYAELDGVAADVAGYVALIGSAGYGTVAIPGQLILSGEAHFVCGGNSVKECVDNRYGVFQTFVTTSGPKDTCIDQSSPIGSPMFFQNCQTTIASGQVARIDVNQEAHGKGPVYNDIATVTGYVSTDKIPPPKKFATRIPPPKGPDKTEGVTTTK